MRGNRLQTYSQLSRRGLFPLIFSQMSHGCSFPEQSNTNALRPACQHRMCCRVRDRNCTVDSCVLCDVPLVPRVGTRQWCRGRACPARSASSTTGSCAGNLFDEPSGTRPNWPCPDNSPRWYVEGTVRHPVPSGTYDELVCPRAGPCNRRAGNSAPWPKKRGRREGRALRGRTPRGCRRRPIRL